MNALRISAVFCLLVVNESPSISNDETVPAAAELKHGEISVHLKGAVSISTQLKAGADPKSHPFDKYAWQLSSAWVNAGGMDVALDWNDSKELYEELFALRIDRRGGVSLVEADVTGRMVFRPSKQVHHIPRIVGAGVDRESLVPVLIVESLQIQIVGPTGEPLPGQPKRSRVTAEKR